MRGSKTLSFFCFVSVFPVFSVVRSGSSPGPLADIGPAPAVSLIDATGRPFELASLRGKAVVVSFIYTTCNGSCPATTHTLYRVQEVLKDAGLWGERVHFVSITLDRPATRPR